MPETCGIIAPRRVGFPLDIDGCIKPAGHDGAHQFHAEGKAVTWETDFDCNCKDCQSEEPDDWCHVYTVEPLPTKE